MNRGKEDRRGLGCFGEQAGVAGPETVEREEDGEDSAVTVGTATAADARLGIVSLKNVVGDPEAEARAGAGFGGEEGFEDTAFGFV